MAPSYHGFRASTAKSTERTSTRGAPDGLAARLHPEAIGDHFFGGVAAAVAAAGLAVGAADGGAAAGVAAGGVEAGAPVAAGAAPLAGVLAGLPVPGLLPD